MRSKQPSALAGRWTASHRLPEACTARYEVGAETTLICFSLRTERVAQMFACGCCFLWVVPQPEISSLETEKRVGLCIQAESIKIAMNKISERVFYWSVKGLIIRSSQKRKYIIRRQLAEILMGMNI